MPYVTFQKKEQNKVDNLFFYDFQSNICLKTLNYHLFQKAKNNRILYKHNII